MHGYPVSRYCFEPPSWWCIQGHPIFCDFIIRGPTETFLQYETKTSHFEYNTHTAVNYLTCFKGCGASMEPSQGPTEGPVTQFGNHSDRLGGSCFSKAGTGTCMQVLFREKPQIAVKLCISSLSDTGEIRSCSPSPLL